ncbi:hypothetical protein ACFFX0_15030 [Citricoccus parietis]|uniref:Secreted protein n=1 Tax=Citricoccus parietis TaxID=592307 RepID=A0ABV5G0J5_9MICC
MGVPLARGTAAGSGACSARHGSTLTGQGARIGLPVRGVAQYGWSLHPHGSSCAGPVLVRWWSVRWPARPPGAVWCSEPTALRMGRLQASSVVPVWR